MLKDIVKSVFCENNNDPSNFPTLILPEEISLMKNIRATMTELALVNHKPFEDQIMKLYQVSRINQGEWKKYFILFFDYNVEQSWLVVNNSTNFDCFWLYMDSIALR